MTATAADAVKAAAAAGNRLHRVVLINPVNEKENRFTSTEAMDYPCSNMKEFETLVGVAREVLRGVLGDESAPIKLQRIDEGGLDGDLCAIMSSGDRAVVAVVWPTAEKLPILKKLAADSAIKNLLIINPLWKTEGNLVSEFGILPWDRKANEEFVGGFASSYLLFEQRIGAPSSVNLARGTRYETGAVVRIQKVWPDKYEVHVMAADGVSQAIGGFESKPTYKELEALINKARTAKLEIFEVAKAASSLDLEAARGRAAATDDADTAEQLAGSFPTREALLAEDPKAVRRLLVSLGLPGSGTPAKLQARALAIADALAAGDSFEAAVKVAQKLR
ncbi:MAG: hypothetical protein J3K34DRAFT_446931 [Monoraphidium minutum]|nr:MAG: hypothetical protein J3K34DRAFT_446931 [Monoraphidium minutum]